MFNRRSVMKTAAGLIGVNATLHALPATAHREQLSLSNVSWNAATRTLNVTHSFHIHEAETALAQTGLIRAPDLTRLEARAQLALYTEQHFTLQTLDANTVPLELVGAEIQGRSAYVYQQASLSVAPTGFIISCDLFRTLVPGQINHVDVNITGKTHSLRFEGQDGPKRVQI